jgi:protein-disulfide isomerase
MQTARRLVPVFFVAGLLGCPKNGDQAPPPQPQNDAKPAAAGEMRLDPNTVVATWSDQRMTYGELYEKRKSVFNKLKFKYLQDLYAAEQRELEAYVIEQLVEKAAKAKNQTQEQYLNAIASTATVKDEDILKFYEQRVKQTGQPLEEIKPRIAAYLMQSAQQEAVRLEFKRLLAEAKLEMKVPAPEGATVEFQLAGRPFMGDPNAKIKIVEFSDFQCPYCDRARVEMTKTMASFPKDVAFYFLHFPLDSHPEARPAAAAAECANRQGKFWPLHDKLFENAQALSPTVIDQLAQQVGLDMAMFNACKSDPTVTKLVAEDQAQGEEAGVEGTPSFFINGVPYSKGVPTEEDIRALLGS